VPSICQGTFYKYRDAVVEKQMIPYPQEDLFYMEKRGNEWNK
jgi:hypothetical protein